MSPTDQDKLFVSLRKTHSKWSMMYCSGYVHGAKDEGVWRNPRKEFRLPTSGCHDDYTLGYLTGFAIHRGVDAETEPWFAFMGLPAHRIAKVR